MVHAGGSSPPGKRHEHGDQAVGNSGIEADQTGQAIENTAQKNSRHLCQLLNRPVGGFLPLLNQLVYLARMAC